MPTPEPGPDAAVAWVRAHLGDLALEGPGGVTAVPALRGGQTAADAALAAFDARGYAGARNEVWPPERRGASVLSPHIRYGLLPLPRVWAHVAGAPARDREKFRDELLWQEYARHLYARIGRRLRAPLRFTPPPGEPGWPEPWPRDMRCMDTSVGQLEGEGWLVNQQRLWLSSQHTVRAGFSLAEGGDRFFSHLLDGSRAANGLGWQWAAGCAVGKPYGFSRWQVEKRAPGLCRECARRDDCPVQEFPGTGGQERVEPPPALRKDPGVAATAGPAAPAPRADGADPQVVWLTGESLGDADPALAAHPDLPVVFVFDEEVLAGMRLSGKRLVFLVETLADLATRREVEVHRGDPVAVVAGRDAAVTFAPVPGFRRRVAPAAPAVVHPWPWLVPPHAGPAQSFTGWRRAAEKAARRDGAGALAGATAR